MATTQRKASLEEARFKMSQLLLELDSLPGNKAADVSERIRQFLPHYDEAIIKSGHKRLMEKMDLCEREASWKESFLRSEINILLGKLADASHSK